MTEETGAVHLTDHRLDEGHYARKQIFCKDRLIAWSHRSRFEIGLDLAREYASGTVLDYGCGDGTFLSLLSTGNTSPISTVGCEISQQLVDDCSRRFGGSNDPVFMLADDLDSSQFTGRFKAIFCMEVLEHVIDVNLVLTRLSNALSGDGVLLVSVPVETGLPLLFKQMVRRIAGWRGIGDYPGISPYTTGEFLKSIFSGRTQQIQRPIHRGDDGHLSHNHKGFNWRVVHRALQERFKIERVLSSPVRWLPTQFASQIWFVCRKRG